MKRLTWSELRAAGEGLPDDATVVLSLHELVDGDRAATAEEPPPLWVQAQSAEPWRGHLMIHCEVVFLRDDEEEGPLDGFGPSPLEPDFHALVARDALTAQQLLRSAQSTKSGPGRDG